MKFYTIQEDAKGEGKKKGSRFDFLKAFEYFQSGKFEVPQHLQAFWQSVEQVKNLEEADVFILPLSWNYYFENKELGRATREIREAKKLNIPVVTWVSGDQGITVPVEDVFVVRQSGYASKRLALQSSMPVMFNDPMLRFYKQAKIIERPYNAKPSIGFCGQADHNFLRSIFDVSRIAFRNLQYRVGYKYEEPQALLATTSLRNKILQVAEKHVGLLTQFIRRKKYRGGAQTDEQMHKTTMEFYDNMVDSDYIVCVRGGGNFSVRFYETLAMGRIPLYIHTDGVLPFDDVIDWHKHAVWIDIKDLNQLGDKLLAFHKQFTPESFVAMQQANRKIWEEHMTMFGYFKNYFERYVLN
jgi:hypothetical protein